MHAVLRRGLDGLDAIARAAIAVAFSGMVVVVAAQVLLRYAFNSSLDWVVLNTISSDGVNQTAFDSWQHTLPANAKHNKFRLRFRAAVDAQDDDWFIDDVRVVTVIVPANDECTTALAVGRLPAPAP